MNPWFETTGVIMVAILGAALGRTFSGVRKSYWALGYLLPMLLIATMVTARCTNSLALMQPLFWVTTGRAKFVILAFAVTMGLTTPLSRLPRKCEKVVVCILMAVVVAWYSVLPFLAPAFVRDQLTNLQTKFDSDGICFQSTDYTCAPAAAVTALKRLGFSAQEGELAILSHTSPVAGTLLGCLRTALENRYGGDGLQCRHRYFDSIDQLKNAGLTLAVVKDAFLSDHCVTVLEVSDRTVLVADPVKGKQLMSHEQFKKVWRFSGIVLKRDATRSI